MNKKYERLNRRVTLSPIAGITRVGDEIPQHIQESMAFAAPEVRRAVGLAKGLVLKEEGQAAATAAALPWHDRGLNWISGRPGLSLLTADDLIESIGLPTGYIHTNWNNAVGALFTSARRLELIHSTGNYVKSARKSNHAAVIAVWQRTFEGALR